MDVARPDALLLDYAGVLTTDYAEHEYPAELAAKFGIAVEDFKVFNHTNRAMSRLSVGELTEDDVARLVVETFEDARVVESHDFVTAYYDPDPEILQRLRKIKDLSLVRLALCSNIFPAGVQYLKARNISEYVDDLFLSCNMGHRKPNLSYFN